MAAETDTTLPELRETVASLPTGPGIYQFKNSAGKVIYVGKAKNIRSRVRSYFRDPRQLTGKTQVLVGHITDLEIIITSSEVEALILENNLIKELKPRYNVNLKDDKTYPWLVITGEPFPRVFISRNRTRDKSTWFGPYTEAGQLRSILELIGSIFPVRSCRYSLTPENIAAKKHKLCLDYHIGKCKGPCEGLQNEAEYLEMIGEIVRLLKGRTAGLLKELHEKMLTAAAELRFEEAAELKMQLQSLRRYADRQKMVAADGMDRDVSAIASGDDEACGVVFRIREGKMLGARHFILTNTAGEPEKKLLGKVLEGYYLKSPEAMPEEVLLSAQLDLEDTESLQALSREREEECPTRRKAVKFTVPQIGEKAHLVEMCRQNARHHLAEYLVQKQKRGEAAREHYGVKALGESLHLETPPKRIECFDNSHLQGTDYVSSMVCFVNGKPLKSAYRKFRLQSLEEACGTGSSDDYAAMEQVLGRRYGGSLQDELPLPDLIVVDGGKGQANSAKKVLDRLGITVPVIGLAKRLEEVFTPDADGPFNLPKTSPALKLLQQLRDEAHRFAITYHRNIRSKRTLETGLTTIPGVGEKIAFALLERFGSVDGVAAASAEELSQFAGKVKGMSIFRHYHP
ncbi:excinuclease ABC subunit UvrC [Pelodictyon luteolum]|uniref:UvrABC system protein C n=1 Tax=Chlorobium luteolum (strain DSM 273 / BCRC 81028 / 2530) TaxID=319225 RepID=UVRC_CHLL3|nr:excinuclease ABC subunit UvrC [Pelodictyon luteolum]Q3B5K8.1 RecName: Full=UvrABC system protein C; Short=Protein UvrC; AltName: Full=Excinuclease ABC subunit C [Pelodictyon luteolum DSM 273]ABB23373.1 Excinuclease ABC subunit C [Pelodictyon luteolum DSM 273]